MRNRIYRLVEGEKKNKRPKEEGTDILDETVWEREKCTKLLR